MSMQIIALILVVTSFSVLFTWVFWPSNRERLEAQGKLILEPEETRQGEKS